MAKGCFFLLFSLSLFYFWDIYGSAPSFQVNQHVSVPQSRCQKQLIFELKVFIFGLYKIIYASTIRLG
ncbi:hypothetical protein CLU79DRAFT_761703 [Phycomyces nitens]|nr:hypothetical protein CLU79DRAFT_761703 [Phycomyces nitens]